MDLKEKNILDCNILNHWYYLSKAKAVKEFLKKSHKEKIIDIGSGSGFFSEYLLDHMDLTEAWCIDTSYDEDRNIVRNKKNLYYRKSIDKIDAKIILMMDVIEHVDKDCNFLTSYVEKALPGTKFLISVPAFQFLWSSHDVFLEHKRRYSLKQIEDLVNQSGLTIIQSSYFFGTIFPLAASIRILSRLFFYNSSPKSNLANYPNLINYLLLKICTLEIYFMKYNKYAGLTVFCYAEKIIKDE